MQADVVQLALDLLVREPDIDSFFGALTKTMVEEGECHTCAVWLLEEGGQRCEPWMAYVKDRLLKLRTLGGGAPVTVERDKPAFPCDAMAEHLFGYSPVWTRTVEYSRDDERLPEVIREYSRCMDWDVIVATPLVLGSRTLGWMTVSSARGSECDSQWWRVMLIEAIARQAALALHHSRLVELNRVEERRKAILEERNRLARDIHDNLAQGFAAILMQLQGAQREAVHDDACCRVEHRDGGGAGARPPHGGAAVGGGAASERGQRRRHRDRAQASRRHRATHEQRPHRRHRRRAAAPRQRRGTGDYRHRAGGLDQRGASLARTSHHNPRLHACSRWACGSRLPTTAAALRESDRAAGSA